MSKPSKNHKKASDTAEKLREIKQMQANWMAQRGRHQESGGSGVFDKQEVHAPSKKPANSTPGKKTEKKKEPDPFVWIIGSGQSTKKKSSVRARSASPAGRKSSSSGSTGSGSRTSSRQNSSRTPTTQGKPPTPKTTSSATSVSRKKEKASHVQSGRSRKIYNSEPDLNGVDSKLSNLYGSEINERNRSNSLDKGATYKLADTDARTKISALDAQTASDSDLTEKVVGSSGGLMAPEMFDKLADQIANRVKAEIEQEREKEQYSRPRQMSYDGSDGDDAISSHKCSRCKQLMVPPDHTPTLLIPCGHTMCEACAEDRIKCPTCRTKVASLTCNTTLQSIIQDFVEKRKPGYSLQNSMSTSSQRRHSNQQYSPANYTDGSHRPRQAEDHSVQRQAPNNTEQGKHYADEYQSLMIRSEALQNEEETIRENLEGVSQKLDRQKKQIDNIDREEEKLQSQIAELQERLETLQTHKKEYQDKFKDLEDTQEQETRRLSMVKDTLRTINNSIEKVKMLARNFNVYIGDD